MRKTIVEALERDNLNRPAQTHYYTFQGEDELEGSSDEVTFVYIRYFGLRRILA
jgi:hypothetical protein